MLIISLENAFNIHEKGKFPKRYQTVKSENYETFCVSKLAIWLQKWVTGFRRGDSLVVRGASPGRVIVVSFWEKYVVPRQKSGILNLTIRRGQGNFGIAFIFVSYEERGNYIVVSVGQLSFDCLSYGGCSHRMFRMLLVCTRVLLVGYSCVLVCYSYILVRYSYILMWCFSHDRILFTERKKIEP